MSKDKISDYSATANSNTDIGGINIDEGCAPSGINDAIRTLMKQLKDWQSGSQDVYIHPAGSASVPSITATGDTNTGLFFPAADTVGIATGGTERARVDSSGNLGLGVTPSVWSNITALQVKSGSLSAGSVDTYLSSNAFYSTNSPSGWKYITSTTATQFYQNASGGEFVWRTAASGTAGNAITFTQAMTLDASGNLLVGTTSTSYSAANRTVLALGSGANGSLIDFQVSGATSDGYIYFDGTNATIENSNAGYLRFSTAAAERARITSSGELLVGRTSGTSNTIAITTGSQGTRILLVTDNGTQQGAAAFFNCTNGGESAAATGMTVKANSSTGRSINAGGTINASGADYAEYMTKTGDFIVAKGDVVGINAEGKLTNVFADSVSFCVKSTDPSYVGGDVWGSAESLGLINPEQPIKREATENTEAETDEEFAIRQAQYETDKAAFEAALEVARQKVDRIAFAGQVPVNVTGATAGQFIVPTNDNGAIKGVAVNEADMTMSQYIKAVGKVIAIEQDGRARIIVKVA